MSIVSFASDLSKILQEQISILKSTTSLKQSLKKLLDQKELSERWCESEILIQPAFLFHEAITSKSEIISAELKKLR